MTITAYETLYESSIAYGIRKALMAEQRRTEMNHKLKELAFAKKDLQSQVENLKRNIEEAQIRAAERREAEEKVHADEVDKLQRFNEQVKGSLESHLSAPKK